MADFSGGIEKKGRSTMTETIPTIPPEWNCQVLGYLYDSEEPAELSQDMLEVSLPSGVLIDAGWVPDGDPNGHYEVTASYGLTELRTVQSDDIYQAAADVIELAKEFRNLDEDTILQADAETTETLVNNSTPASW